MLSAQIRVGHQFLEKGWGDSLPQPRILVFASHPPSVFCLSKPPRRNIRQSRAILGSTLADELPHHTHTHTVSEAQEIILRLYHDQYELLGLSSLSAHSRMPGLLAGDISWVCMRWDPMEGSVDAGGC